MKFINLLVVTVIIGITSFAQAYECTYKTSGYNYTRANGGLNVEFEDGKSYNIYECVDAAIAAFNKADVQTTGRFGFQRTIQVLPHTLKIEIDGDETLTDGHLKLLNSKFHAFQNPNEFMLETFVLDGEDAAAKIKRVE